MADSIRDIGTKRTGKPYSYSCYLVNREVTGKYVPSVPTTQSKEDTRLATIERLFGDDRRVETAAKMFDEAAEREATEIAEGTAQSH